MAKNELSARAPSFEPTRLAGAGGVRAGWGGATNPQQQPQASQQQQHMVQQQQQQQYMPQQQQHMPPHAHNMPHAAHHHHMQHQHQHQHGGYATPYGAPPQHIMHPHQQHPHHHHHHHHHQHGGQYAQAPHPHHQQHPHHAQHPHALGHPSEGGYAKGGRRGPHPSTLATQPSNPAPAGPPQEPQEPGKDAFAELHKTDGPKKFVARSAAKDAAATTSALPTSKSAYKPPGQASNDAEAIAERRRKNEQRDRALKLAAVKEKEGAGRIAIDKECTLATEQLVKDEVVGAEEAKAAEEARIEEEKKNYDVVSLTKREWDARNLAALFTCKDGVVYLLHAEQNLLNDFMGQVLHSFAVEGAHTVVSSLDDLKLEEMPAEVELKFRKLTEPTGDFAEELVRPRDAAKIRQNVQKLLAKNTNLRMAQIEKHVVETVVCTPDLEHVTSIYALMKASTQIPHTQAIHALTLVGCEGVKTNMALARLCKDASTVAYITAALADCMDQDRRKFLGSLKALLGVAADSEAVAGIDLCAEAYEQTLREEEERVEAERLERERAEKERLDAAERAAEEAEQRRKEREADAARAGPSADAPAGGGGALRAPKDNKLASKWVLWHTPKLEAGATGWVQPRPMCTISDVPTFWAMAGALPPASSLDNKCAYAMFREGVEPKWEDEANKSGGQWVATINPRDSNINDGWSQLMVKCVGESFARYQNKVVGVQLECKTLWRLTLWLNDAHTHVRDQLGEEFESVLRGSLDRQSPEIQFHLNSKISLNGGKMSGKNAETVIQPRAR